mmetsp:Transcript_104156/g.184977  ORF Transcript_104156/g.184977 Transcript_104156/m.184977 type:complete len:805 (+) Transcript_104156:63-2477(+)
MMSNGQHSARLINATTPEIQETKLKVLDEETYEKTEPVRALNGTGLSLRMDDDHCVMVIIFPRGKQAGGAVDPKQEIEDPLDMAERIFKIYENPDSYTAHETCKRIQENETVSADEYHADVRELLIKTLEKSGVNCVQFPSLDGDEDFLKLDVPADSPTLKFMAEKLRYKMAFKAEVYEPIPACGPFKGAEPMRNDDDKVVVAFDEYTVAKDHMFEDFDFVDRARILEFWLDQWVSLDEMLRQGIISAYFPCPKAEDMEKVHEDVGSLLSFYKLPNHTHEQILRDYFGEEITFFFRFMAFLTRSLVTLAFIGVAYYIGKKTHLIKSEDLGYARSGIALVTSIWASVLFQRFKLTTARVKQYWGCSDYEEHEQVRPDWDYHKQNSSFMTILVNVFTIVYVCLYVGAISVILAWGRNAVEEGKSASTASLVLTIVIKAGSFIWGKLAPKLTDLENHRTEDSYASKLIVLLSSVKLFVALWPFIMQCFLTNITNIVCASTLDKALEVVWKGRPVTAEMSKVMQDHFSFANDEVKGGVCVTGCYPIYSQDIFAYSQTNCDDAASTSVRTYFIFQIVSEVVFIIIGIVLTKLAVRSEMQKASDRDGGKPYSLLQWHAKTWTYELESWSGSQIEDYLDIAIAYSIVVCFGIVSPVMAIIAVAAFCFSYRLRIYRLIFVARRPLPRSTAGLGIWASIFDYINIFAVLCNVGLACAFFYPGRSYTAGTQVLAFVVGEHGLIALKMLVDFLIPDDPKDVENIGHYNRFVLCHVQQDAGSMIPEPKHHVDLRGVNLTLNPDGVGSGSSDDSDDS